MRQGAVGLVQAALLVAAAVMFIRWLRLCYRNTDVIAPGLRRYGHGWAIGAWFVPFLNLWRPKQIVNDIWRAGEPSGSPHAAELPVLLNLWWAGWIVANVLGQIAGRLAFSQETLDELRTVDALYIASDAFDAIVAVLAILVVRRITRRLEDRGALAEDAPAGWAPPQAPAQSSCRVVAAGARATRSRRLTRRRFRGREAGSTGPGASLTRPVRYPSDDLTEAERARLAPHVTDLDGPVFALVNLPETVKGALFARYSRYPGTLRRLFLEEFADSLPEGGAWDGSEGERAAQLYERIFVGYGDDSVAQLGGAHVACEWVSNVHDEGAPAAAAGRVPGAVHALHRLRRADARRRLPLLPRRRARAASTRPRWTRCSTRTRRRCRACAHGSTRRTRARTASRRRRAPARSTRRRSTCCAGCSPRRRCRTWASTRPASPTSS